MGGKNATPRIYAEFVGEEVKGESRVLKNVYDIKNPMTAKDTDTVLHQFLSTSSKYGKTRFLGSREKLPDGSFGKYKWKTYEEVKGLAIALAKGIESQKIYQIQEYLGKEVRSIGIYSKTREEWLITDIACWMISATSVPLYDTLGEESIDWIFEQTCLSTVFLSAQGISKLIDMKKKSLLPTLKLMICYDEIEPSHMAAAKEVGLEIMSYADLLKKGETATTELRPCKPDDLMTICYTSGTTSRCKGVEILHRAFYCDAAGHLEMKVLTSAKI